MHLSRLLTPGIFPVTPTLCVHYPDSYPDVLPELSFKIDDEDFTDEDSEKLLTELRTVVILVSLNYDTDSPTMRSGRRKSRNGHDFHAGITS